MSWFTGWFGHGLGAGAAKALLSETKATPGAPVRQQTEAEIRADEARYDEDARRLEEQGAAVEKHSKG